MEPGKNGTQGAFFPGKPVELFKVVTVPILALPEKGLEFLDVEMLQIGLKANPFLRRLGRNQVTGSFGIEAEVIEGRLIGPHGLEGG